MNGLDGTKLSLQPFSTGASISLVQRHYRLDPDTSSYTLSQTMEMLSLLGSRLPYRSCLISKHSPETDDDRDA